MEKIKIKLEEHDEAVEKFQKAFEEWLLATTALSEEIRKKIKSESSKGSKQNDSGLSPL